LPLAKLHKVQGAVTAQKDEAASELEKAQAYARYRDLLLAHDRLDFGDQVSLALRILRERPHVLRQMHDQYRFILVDEFQDTNHAQFELIRLLAGPRQNLTVVGDDDQSIYRFRGAKMANLLAFLDAFPSADTVVLTTNYRSRQNLLDASYRLIQQNNPDRLEAKLQERGGRRFEKRLQSAFEGEGLIEHHEFHTASDEADFVVGTIGTAIQAGRRPREWLSVLVHASSGQGRSQSPRGQQVLRPGELRALGYSTDRRVVAVGVPARTHAGGSAS